MTERSERCPRCDLVLHGHRDPTDCRYCDPLCPVWGTHGHLWAGDEDEARARYEAEPDDDPELIEITLPGKAIAEFNAEQHRVSQGLVVVQTLDWRTPAERQGLTPDDCQRLRVMLAERLPLGTVDEAWMDQATRAMGECIAEILADRTEPTP